MPTLSLHDEWLCPDRADVDITNREFLEDGRGFKAYKGRKNGCIWHFVRCNRDLNQGVAHSNAIVIAVDGACRNNGQPNAQGAFAVYIGENNPGNGSWYAHNRPTNQRMELLAGIKGLQAAIDIEEEAFESQTSGYTPPNDRTGPLRALRRVVIKTDSKYLNDAMTDWIYEWRENEYIDSTGRRVINADLFMRLENLVNELNDKDIEVNFWHVPRRLNVEADRMANEVLDQHARR